VLVKPRVSLTVRSHCPVPAFPRQRPAGTRSLQSGNSSTDAQDHTTVPMAGQLTPRKSPTCPNESAQTRPRLMPTQIRAFPEP
jgi:hypothetical protein